jgi:hypothetical protein
MHIEEVKIARRRKNEMSYRAIVNNYVRRNFDQSIHPFTYAKVETSIHLIED